MVHSQCDFYGAVAFPSIVDLGLRVTQLGKSSVTYEVGVFERGADDVRAVGGFTHVFVDRQKNRPAANGMPARTKEGLEKIYAKQSSKL